MPPKILAKNADRTGGVLPVNAAARASPSKGSASRLKLEIRRLPPGLTLTEFEETLGDEWRLGSGIVDWREYRQGKVKAVGSGKVPEQSRCYLHLANEGYVRELEKRFLEVVFQDKAGTFKNPDLKNLQPTLSFAPNQRTPLQQAKQRTDTRQGTIDQDPEFIAFLESETQPITRPAALDLVASEKDAEKKEVKTTPLIEDLREKKANRAKAAQAKAEKAEKDKKAQATKGPNKTDPAVADKDATKAVPQSKVDQAAKDAAKVLNKQVAGKQQPPQPKPSSPGRTKKVPSGPKQQQASSTPTQPTPASSSPSPASQRVPPGQRPRGSAEGIKKMLQKDLGIKPKPPTAAQPNVASSPATTPASSAVTSPTPETKPTPASQSTASTAPSSLAESTTPQLKAYLKHANPSQGMTEVLIQQALAQYGEIGNVTIDPRKGTAIAVFKQSEGLKKALKAKRVPVANGAVEVLEFRDRPLGTPGTRGGFRGGRGGRGGTRGASTASPQPS